MFSNRLLRRVLIPERPKKLFIDKNMLRKLLLQKKITNSRQSCSRAITQKQVVMYNSTNNNIPSFFNFQKNINGQYFQIIGKKIDNSKYVVRIIDGTNNRMKEMTVSNSKIKDIVSGKINFSNAVTTIMNTNKTIKKKPVAKKKSVVKKKPASKKKSVLKKKPASKKKSVVKKKPVVKKKSTPEKKVVPKKKLTPKKKSVSKKKK